LTVDVDDGYGERHSAHAAMDIDSLKRRRAAAVELRPGALIRCVAHCCAPMQRRARQQRAFGRGRWRAPHGRIAFLQARFRASRAIALA